MKLHIFGASGSGVTTLGQALSIRLQIPYFDSDAYFWEPSVPPFTVRRAPVVRNELLMADLMQQPGWILGGSVINWGLDWNRLFDLVVFLWVPPAIRIARVEKREFERYGGVIFTDPQRNQQFREFIDWASGYDNGQASGRTLKAHENWLANLTRPVLELRGDLSIDQRIILIMNKLIALNS